RRRLSLGADAREPVCAAYDAATRGRRATDAAFAARRRRRLPPRYLPHRRPAEAGAPAEGGASGVDAASGHRAAHGELVALRLRLQARPQSFQIPWFRSSIVSD